MDRFRGYMRNLGDELLAGKRVLANVIFGADFPDNFYSEGIIGEWVLCLNCSRCYRVGESKIVIRRFRSVDVLVQRCPYHDCDGVYLLDTWLWDHFRLNSPYPQKPKRGRVYRRFVEKAECDFLLRDGSRLARHGA